MGNMMSNRGHRTAIFNYFNTGRKIASKGHRIAISIGFNMGRKIANQGHKIAISIISNTGRKIARQGHRIAIAISFNMGRKIANQGHKIAISINSNTGRKIARQGHKIAYTINIARDRGGRNNADLIGCGTIRSTTKLRIRMTVLDGSPRVLIRLLRAGTRFCWLLACPKQRTAGSSGAGGGGGGFGHLSTEEGARSRTANERTFYKILCWAARSARTNKE
jgi:hypothetical protein